MQRPTNERRYSDSQEAMKCWSGHSQGGQCLALLSSWHDLTPLADGYVSFPDFEYFQDYTDYGAQDPQREGIKT